MAKSVESNVLSNTKRSYAILYIHLHAGGHGLVEWLEGAGLSVCGPTKGQLLLHDSRLCFFRYMPFS